MKKTKPWEAELVNFPLFSTPSARSMLVAMTADNIGGDSS
jgi:hypothetical protein